MIQIKYKNEYKDKKMPSSMFIFEDIGINVFKLFFQIKIIFNKDTKE